MHRGQSDVGARASPVENSLGLALVLLFLRSIAGRCAVGVHHLNEEQARHAQPGRFAARVRVGWGFWFESLQNWQSEFLSICALVVLTIFLRQRGSPGD